GDKIVTLQTIDPIYVDFYLPQKQLGGVQLGQVVHVTTDGFAGETFAGKVTAVNAKVDPTTRNVLIEATLPNAKRQLLPGMFANVEVEAGAKRRYLTLPQTAVTYNPYGSTVFVVRHKSELEAAARAASAAASHAASATTAATAAAPASAASAGDDSLVVQQVFVTTGETRGDQVAIVKGVTEGEIVVTSGQVKLKNGTPIVINNSVQPANNPNPKPQEK
ncbi:MAG: efflux RND transporter periplasmic adaptor subunit, partial [Caldimonas sp.]